MTEYERIFKDGQERKFVDYNSFLNVTYQISQDRAIKNN